MTDPKRVQRAERERAPGGGAKPRYDVAERLLMAMVWLRLYLTCEAVEVLFDVDKSTVSRKTQIIVNEHGRIRHVSHSVPGSVHDLTLLRQSKAMEVMPPDVTTMGDSGYQVCRARCPSAFWHCRVVPATPCGEGWM